MITIPSPTTHSLTQALIPLPPPLQSSQSQVLIVPRDHPENAEQTGFPFHFPSPIPFRSNNAPIPFSSAHFPLIPKSHLFQHPPAPPAHPPLSKQATQRPPSTIPSPLSPPQYSPAHTYPPLPPPFLPLTAQTTLPTPIPRTNLARYLHPRLPPSPISFPNYETCAVVPSPPSAIVTNNTRLNDGDADLLHRLRGHAGGGGID